MPLVSILDGRLVIARTKKLPDGRIKVSCFGPYRGSPREVFYLTPEEYDRRVERRVVEAQPGQTRREAV